MAQVKTCFLCSTSTYLRPAPCRSVPLCSLAVGAAAGEESKAGDFVMTSIQRVFGNNFKGDATEPKEWSSTGGQAGCTPVAHRRLLGGPQ
jgi:hypothetical protein